MRSKLKKLDLLKTKDAAEKDLVKHVVASILDKLGEEKTVKLLHDLNQANVKLVDFVDALSGTALDVPDPPVMRWNEKGKPDYSHLGEGSPDHIEVVRKHLTAKYGGREGRAKLRAMSGLEVVQLSDQIRKEQEETIKETGKVHLGGGREMYPAPRINWSKVKKRHAR